MATYIQIQEYVKSNYWYDPKTCWIAHAKELSGIPVQRSHNRIGARQYPVPKNKLHSIQKLFDFLA